MINLIGGSGLPLYDMIVTMSFKEQPLPPIIFMGKFTGKFYRQNTKTGIKRQKMVEKQRFLFYNELSEGRS
jgi:hypothetical protein